LDDYQARQLHRAAGDESTACELRLIAQQSLAAASNLLAHESDAEFHQQ